VHEGCAGLEGENDVPFVGEDAVVREGLSGARSVVRRGVGFGPRRVETEWEEACERRFGFVLALGRLAMR
jgi:hypothetical protein